MRNMNLKKNVRKMRKNCGRKKNAFNLEARSHASYILEALLAI